MRYTVDAWLSPCSVGYEGARPPLHCAAVALSTIQIVTKRHIFRGRPKGVFPPRFRANVACRGCLSQGIQERNDLLPLRLVELQEEAQGDVPCLALVTLDRILQAQGQQIVHEARTG